MDYASFFDFQFAPPISAALDFLELQQPTPIQKLAIAPQMAGRDLLGLACTGSGKTAAFGLPLLHALLTARRPPTPRGCHALVLAPTRELAGQIAASFRALAGAAPVRICAISGGSCRRKQISYLSAGADVVVATPGRLIDLMQARAITLGSTRHLIIDEADRMLDLGFLEPVRRIAAHLPAYRQTVMFSATMPAPLATLSAQLLRDPVWVKASPPIEAQHRIVARAEIVAAASKFERLVELVGSPSVRSAIVFCRTRRSADALGQALARTGVRAGVIHGERRQEDRSRTLARFRRGSLNILIATDLVARGIDVPGVSHVINFDLPDDTDTYIHRIGRTGRAGAQGEAITLCAPADLRKLRCIEKATGQRLLPTMRPVDTSDRRLRPTWPLTDCDEQSMGQQL